MDYYSVLGVSRDADNHEIKRAYKKLASIHHPDKGGNEAEFKKVQEAYDTLGNAEKKHWYDVNSHRDPVEDLFSRFRNAHRNYNPDAVMDITITAEEVFTGKQITINGPQGLIDIDIPSGSNDGDQYCIQNGGLRRNPGAPAGDLYIRVKVHLPGNIKKVNSDVYMDVAIDALDAMLGTEITIDYINGKRYNITVPKASQEGQRIRLSGLGFPDRRRNTVGDLYVVVRITVPNFHDQEIINVLNIIKHKRGNNGK